MRRALAIHNVGPYRVRVYGGHVAHVYEGRRRVFCGVVLVPTVELTLGTWDTGDTAREVVSLYADGYSTRARKLA